MDCNVIWIKICTYNVQRRMNNAFKHLNLFLVAYSDDILISSKTLKEHWEHLKTFAKTVLIEEICLSERKATIKQEKVEALGFQLASNVSHYEIIFQEK